MNKTNQQAPEVTRGEAGITYDEVVEDSFPASDPPPYTRDPGATWSDERVGQLRGFFDKYEAALSAPDLKMIAAAYADQFIAAGPDFRTCNCNDDQFRAGLDEAAKIYRQIGVHSIRINAYKETSLDLDFSLVKIEWKAFRQDGSQLVAFDNTYVVQTVEDEPKIIFFIAHNEQQRWRERGLIPS